MESKVSVDTLDELLDRARSRLDGVAAGLQDLGLNATDLDGGFKAWKLGKASRGRLPWRYGAIGTGFSSR